MDLERTQLKVGSEYLLERCVEKLLRMVIGIEAMRDAEGRF